MGQTYYYYVSALLPFGWHVLTVSQYELDGTTEIHDSTVPSTTDCPYLPGQTVNTLFVPVEQSLRKRSASLSSMRDSDWKTMDPKDKYTNPKPPRPALPTMPASRVSTAPSTVRHKRSARSLSPGSNWLFSPRKLFNRKASSSSLRENVDPSGHTEVLQPTGPRSRDISPESLRRFLSDDTPLAIEQSEPERPTLAIPEDIVEENEDDDNFATSATLSPLDSAMHFTVLSPPPSQHSHSRCTTPTFPAKDATLETEASETVQRCRSPPRLPQMTIASPRSGTSFYDPELMTPTSPQSTTSNEIPSFYNSDNEYDEDAEDENYPLHAIGLGLGGVDSFNKNKNLSGGLSTYSLPMTADTIKKPVMQQQTSKTGSGSPEIICRDGNDVPAGNTSLLTCQIPNAGLDELMNELGWMAGFIHGKH